MGPLMVPLVVHMMVYAMVCAWDRASDAQMLHEGARDGACDRGERGNCGQGAPNPMAEKLRKYCGAVTKPPPNPPQPQGATPLHRGHTGHQRVREVDEQKANANKLPKIAQLRASIEPPLDAMESGLVHVMARTMAHGGGAFVGALAKPFDQALVVSYCGRSVRPGETFSRGQWGRSATPNISATNTVSPTQMR